MHSFAILGAGGDALRAAGSLRRLCGQTMGSGEKHPPAPIHTHTHTLYRVAL